MSSAQQEKKEWNKAICTLQWCERKAEKIPDKSYLCVIKIAFRAQSFAKTGALFCFIERLQSYQCIPRSQTSFDREQLKKKKTHISVKPVAAAAATI